ncbi:MAG: protein kinase, partial [Planctomycetes bacterium]|nr:protein kinase [Planctomycetota bacterium]
MSDTSLEDALADYIARRQSGESLSPRPFVDECLTATNQDERFGARLLDAIEAFERTNRQLPDLQALLPERIDAWRVRGFVGQGTFGRVFRVRAVDANPTDPDLALKLLHEDTAMLPRALERFRREGESLQALRIPGIVRCHAAGVFEGCPYLVLDLIEGRSLDAILRSSPDPDWSPARVALLVASLARSIHALHASGFVHRDIKPGNIVLDERTGTPTLVDFGLVGQSDEHRRHGDPTLTKAGDVVGTPAYMSPEQARGEHCDARTDIWALGLVLFELLTSRTPSRPRTAGSKRLEIRERKRRNQALADSGTPPGLIAIHDRATSAFAGDRFADARELANELEAFGQGTRTRTRPELRKRVREAITLHPILLTAVGIVLVIGGTWAIFDARQAQQNRRTMSTLRALDRALAHDEQVERLAFDDLRIELRSALDAWTSNDRSRAFEIASTCAASAPGDAIAGFAAGLTALGTRRFSDASRFLSRSARAFPDVEVCQLQYLRALRAVGARSEAHVQGRTLWERADNRKALAPETTHEIAKAALDQGDTDLARDAIQAALDHPAREPSLSMYNTAAIVASSRGDRERAMRYYELIKERDPQYVLGRYNEAYALDSQCRIDEARRAYEAILVLDPNHAKSLACLAWLHSGSGRATCDKCKAEFEAKPELFDLARAEEYAIAAARSSQSADVLRTVLSVAARLARRDSLRSALTEVQQRKTLSDKELGRVTRALQRLE